MNEENRIQVDNANDREHLALILIKNGYKVHIIKEKKTQNTKALCYVVYSK